MKTGSGFITILVILVLSIPIHAADKVVVVPLNSGGLKCSGTLNGTRWCVNGDGTVTDMENGLVWLLNAGCIGLKPWDLSSGDDDAHTAVALVYDDGTNDCGLSDGSAEGDWRLPTLNELFGLTQGTEGVRSSTPRAFSGVASSYYWSSSIYASDTGNVWVVYLSNGLVNYKSKAFSYYVWPVRGGQ